MLMTPRGRVIQAIKHEQPDVCPWQFGFTTPIAQKMRAHFGQEFPEVLGNHIASIVPCPPGAWRQVKPDFVQDEFGVVWDRRIDKDIGNPHAIFDRPEMGDYQFPDPHDPHRYEGFAAFLNSNPDKLRTAAMGFSLFERAWSLRGMQNLFLDMYEHPEFVDELLDRILDFNLAVIDHCLEYDIDALRFGDDWGHQHGVLMGVPNWRRFFKPRLKQMYGRVRIGGKFVMIHSCGDVDELFPDLIEIGVDVFNPFQPEVMDVFGLKREFGDQLAFFGGISTQRTLPYGTPEEVKQEAKRMIQQVGDGGGYILSPAHDIPGDVPLDNILALMEVVHNQ